MADNVRYKTSFRRRREGKTNYHKRPGLLKSGEVRLVARVMGNSAVAQLVQYKETGDAVLANATSKELKKYEYNGHKGNTSAAYLTGLLIGTKAKQKGIKKANLDIGLVTPTKGANVYGLLKGALDAGLEVPHNAGVLPSEDRINGAHTKTKQDIEKIKQAILKQ